MIQKTIRTTFPIILVFIVFHTLNAQDVGLDTIQTENSKFVIQLKPVSEESTFDKYYKYVKDFLSLVLGPLVALIGIWYTLPILRKKLVENHITTALSKIQVTNIEVQKANQKLIDKYLPLTYSWYRLNKNEIEAIFKKVIKVYYLSQEGSSDVVTVLFYLKITLQKVLKHFDDKSDIYSKDAYNLVINSLKLTNFYCTQVVQIPKSPEIEKRNIINEKIRKYVTFADYTKYKHFDQGVIHDPNSAHYTMFYERVRKGTNTLIKRSAFQIYKDVAPVAKTLYLDRIYAPLILEKYDHESVMHEGSLKLYLIDYSFRNELTLKDGSKRNVIDVVYSNADDFAFVEILNYKKLKEDFEDSFIPNSGFAIEKANKLVPKGLETLTLQFDKAYLEDSFNRNKSKIKRKLKEMVS